MSIVLYSNISALRAQRQLARTSGAMEKTYERLASGARINRASDDAAGLAIASSLRADSRVASVAMRNANDGISAIRIVDSALGTISSVLVRMAELSEQAANGVYSNQQRSALQNEFSAMGSEIGRIAATTSFNDLKLLSNSNVIVFQVGFDSVSTSQVSYAGIRGTLESLALGDGQVMSYSLLGNSTQEAEYAARTALVAVTAAIEEVASRRGSVGAVESRLGVAIDNLQQARENFRQAESRIRDADVATEAANLARLQILQQAASSVALQANQQPALALRLLSS